MTVDLPKIKLPYSYVAKKSRIVPLNTHSAFIEYAQYVIGKNHVPIYD